MAKIGITRKWTTQKTDSDFIKEMKMTAKERYVKNLEKKLPSVPEMTRLLRRTQGYKQSLFELKTKPRREDVKFP